MTQRLCSLLGRLVPLLAAVSSPTALAATATPNSDAFDLAEALAPAPVPGGAAVTGVFTETSHPSQIGTFTDGALTVGFSSGIVLSTGDVSPIGGVSPLSAAFAGSASAETAALLAQIPGLGVTYEDTARFSLEINPGLLNNYVNFSFGYYTSEISPSDRFGLFVNGAYRGMIAGQPVDQGHDWLAVCVPDFGYTQALYPNANTLDTPSFMLSLAVPSPGVPFTLDLIVADVFGDETDTAIFLGNFSASELPLGQVAVPEVNAVAAVGGLLLGWVGCRRLRQRELAHS